MSSARRTQRRGVSPRRLVASLGAAALAHGLLLLLLEAMGWFDLRMGAFATPSAATGSSGDEPSPIEIQTDLPTRDAERIVEALRQPELPALEEKKREEAKKREEEDPHAQGEVVDIERPAIEERPDQAKYLAEYDSRVARETRGASGRDRAGARQAVEGGAQAHLPSPPQVPQGNPWARHGLPGSRRPAAAERSHALRGQGGVADELSEDGRDARPGAHGAPGTSPRPSLGENGVPGRPGAPRPNLQPSEGMLARAIAHGTGSPDYLEGLDDGESTALNAKRFKFASFFNRVKREVAGQWNPSVVYVKHDPTGNVYGVKDRITVVRVHLRPDGTLANVTLMQTSGVGFLDDEAIDAFRRAAPFLNPPSQLVESDGLVHFNFGFIFELGGHTSTRVLRYE